jgi:hypothetical protein
MSAPQTTVDQAMIMLRSQYIEEIAWSLQLSDGNAFCTVLSGPPSKSMSLEPMPKVWRVPKLDGVRGRKEKLREVSDATDSGEVSLCTVF